MERERTFTLLDRYSDGSCTPEERQELEACLSNSPEAQSWFWEHAQLSTLLREACHQDAGREMVDVDAMKELTLSPAMATGRNGAAVVATPARPIGNATSRRSAYGASKLTAVAIAAMLLGSGLTYWLTQDDVNKGAALESPVKGSTLRIESGSATLALPDVGYVVLEGPTELEMLDLMRARLKQGRIRVCVTEETGHGFVVEYPNGRVTDLGTEFGLDVSPSGADVSTTSLVVFDGEVDLERSTAAKQPMESAHVDRLVRGEGVTFRAGGQLDRIMSIVTGNVATFRPGNESRADESDLVILSVMDNLRTSETKKFYEIIPGGLREDALAYVDRPGHDWNGLTEEGMPKYLLGADYIKTFCDDKWRTELELEVTLGRPSKLYVLYDENLKPPEWLRSSFRKTGDFIGRDLDKWPTIRRPVEMERGLGAGNSVDHRFTIWERIVKQPGAVRLGGNGRFNLNGELSDTPHMYGIAAVALESADGLETTEKLPQDP